MVKKVAELDGKFSSFIVENSKDLFVNFDVKAHVVPLVEDSVLLKGLRHPSQSLRYFNEVLLNAPARHVKRLNEFKQFIYNVEKVVDGVEVQERKMRQLLAYVNSVDVVPVGEVFLKVLNRLVSRSKNPNSEDVTYFRTLAENSTAETVMSDFLMEHFILPARSHNMVKPGKLFKFLSGRFLVTVENTTIGLVFHDSEVQNHLTDKVKVMFNPSRMTTFTEPIFIYGAEKYEKMNHVTIHTLKPSSSLTLRNSFTVVCLGKTKISNNDGDVKLDDGSVGVFLNGGKVSGECVIVEEK